MNNILVSVVIPCYNVEQFVRECVVSVINQTYENIEIICIDNNSSDRTWQELIQLQKEYSNIVIEKELKAGACAARNKGLSLAKGEWIQFLDADDLLLPNKIEHQINIIKGANIAFIAAACIKRNIKGIDTELIHLNSDKYLAPFINQCGNTCSNFWNKKALNNINGWNEELKSSQEADLMFRLILNNCDFMLDRVPLTVIRERESGQISQRNPSEKWKQYIDTRLGFMKELKVKSTEIYNKHKNSYVNFLLTSLQILANYDKYLAISLYNNYLKSEHSLGLNSISSLLIKIFGFNLFLNLKKISK